MSHKKKKAPARLTITDYQQLAARCLALLDELAAIISELSETRHTRTGTKPANLNIPLVFLGSAVDAVEHVPQLQMVQHLDVDRGRATLQLMEAFRPVRDKLAAFDRDLVNLLNSRRSSLAGEALNTYAIAKSLALDGCSTVLLACVSRMQRALGRRGRRTKT